MSRAARLRRALIAGVAVCAIGVSLAAWSTDVGRQLELDTVDARFDVRGREDPGDEIVFVAIDDRTFQELGEQWPFPRGIHADAISALSRDGARVIAYDVQFTEETDPAEDQRLIEAVRRAGNVVLATTEVNEFGESAIFGGGEGLSYSRAVESNSNFPTDPGRVIRRMEATVDGLVSFAVATAERARGEPLDTGSLDGGEAWIDFRGPPRTFPRVSFSRLVRGRLPAGAFRDRIVVVGASAPSLQEVADFHATSTTGEEAMAGPEIHAHAISTALRDFPLGESSGLADVLLIVLLGLVAPAAALRLPALAGLGVALAAGGLYLVAVQLAFNAGTILPVVHPLAALVLAALGTLVMHYVTTAFERERVRDLFARFVPESVVDQAIDQADGTRIGGVQREGTVMFSDLRGFTSFAEPLPVERVIEVLNRYLGSMSEAILDAGGTLVAYMGDGIMAVFGAPIEQPDHADRALRAARDMLRRLDDFNDWMRAEGLGEGFRMGIGLNSGEVMSGNVGSERRMEYTAIGDTTNTAARIEGMTKGTPHQVLLSDATRSLLREQPPGLVDAGEHEIRGREARIRLWALAEASGAAPPAGS